MPLVSHAREPSGADPKRERSEGPEVDVALLAWRRKATDVLLIAAATVHLPLVVLAMLGRAGPLPQVEKDIGFAAYVLTAAAALMRRVDYKTRLWVFFLAGYAAIAVTNLASANGPYAQVGLVTLPILVLVLRGAPAAKAAVVTSVTILVAAPLIRGLPGVALRLTVDPTQPSNAHGVDWFRAGVMAAFLFAMMILLDRFHGLLLETLTERIAAQRKMKHEMDERQHLERAIASVSDGERRRLGHELHDGACQQFTAALLHCQVLRRRLQSGELLLDDDFQALSSLLGEGIGEARNIARGLCPLDPDPEALAPALRVLTKRIHEMGTARCEFITAGDVRVADPAMAQHLYRIGQEALSNAIRHAHAGRIAVELRGCDGELNLVVEDDGTGLPPELPTGGLGLQTMAYRARMMDGDLTVSPGSGGGTRVTCRVPRSCGTPAAHDTQGGEPCLPNI